MSGPHKDLIDRDELQRVMEESPIREEREDAEEELDWLMSDD